MGDLGDDDDVEEGDDADDDEDMQYFPWQEKLVAPLDATLKNVAKGTRKGKARDETTLQNKARKTKWTLS